MAEILNIIIVDDHSIFRKGLSLLLQEIPEIKVVAEASNGEELIDILKNKKIIPDIIFMDIKMPKMNGIEATKEVMKINSNIKVFALSMFGEEEYLQSMIEAGVEGFILKKAEKEEIESAIKSAKEGKSYFSHELFDILVKNFGLKKNQNQNEAEKKPEVAVSPRLSNRELEVLQLICKGYSNIQIAEVLFISPRTVDGHKASILSKTGTKNTANLILYAFNTKLVDKY